MMSSSIQRLFERADHLLEVGRAEEALSVAMRATSADPQSYHAWCRVARSQIKLERFSDAVTSAERALALSPEGAWGHLLRALALRRLRRLEEAMDSAKTAVRLDPSYREAHTQRGWILRDQRRWKELAEVADSILHRWPEELDGFRLRADAAWALRDMAAAEELVLKGLALAPHDAFLLTQLASIRARQGPDDAVDLYAAAARADPRDSWRRGNAFAARARRLRLLGDPTWSDLVEEGIRLGGESPWLWRMLVEARLSAFDAAGAAEAGLRALALNPADPGTARMAAQALHEAGDVERAKAVLTAALERYPDDPRFRAIRALHGAWIAEAEKDKDPSWHEILEDAAAEGAWSFDFGAALARSRRLRGEGQRALEAADAAVSDESGSEWPHRERAEVLLALERWDEAREAAETARGLARGTRWEWMSVVILARSWEPRDPARALEYWREARRLVREDPGGGRLLEGLAKALIAVDEIDEAVAVLRERLERFPEDDEVAAILDQPFPGGKTWRVALGLSPSDDVNSPG
jgi:tetratricopeptide (TPR) repeat protein